MADFTIYIGNKNYSSWSLRAWLMLKQSGASFEEVVVPLREATTGGYTQPVLTQNAAQSTRPRPEIDSEPLPQAAEAAETAAIRNGAFIAPKPADAAIAIATTAIPATRI